ncbi:MAG: phosphoglucosamine mutase [Alphaproteobacteria bacterium]
MAQSKTQSKAQSKISLFGTDGIRGQINSEPVTAHTILLVAQAVASVLRDSTQGARSAQGARSTRASSQPHLRVVIGKDTRLGNYMLEAALEAGFTSMGIEVILLGPAPTPAVAMLTRTMRANLGVMISASHNPYQDSGLKIFAADGYKISPEFEREIERRLHKATPSLAPPNSLGRARRLDDVIGRYIEFAKMSFPRGLRLDGYKLVVDCAHGAAYKVAPAVFRELGAKVTVIGDTPNGFNINKDCGAIHPQAMCRATRRAEARLGLALDGDADRVVFADERGRLISGDQVLALVARSWQQSERLRGGAVVGTVMSNLGLEQYLESIGLDFVRAQVGDRHVLAEMRARGCNLGGEESGHLILSDLTTTGDGVIAALQVLGVLLGNRRRAPSAVMRLFTPRPQERINIEVQSRNAARSPAVLRAIADAEHKLGTRGRVLVRASGTEPVVRVLVESDNAKLGATLAAHLARSVRLADGARAPSRSSVKKRAAKQGAKQGAEQGTKRLAKQGAKRTAKKKTTKRLAKQGAKQGAKQLAKRLAKRKSS